MQRNFLTIAVVSALMGACAYHPVPYETIRPEAYQLDMEAADHWNRLAEQVARNIQVHLPSRNADSFSQTTPAAIPTPIEPVAMGSDPLVNLPPGTLPPPGQQPSNNAPEVIELNLNDPTLGLSPQPGMDTMSVASATPIPLGNPTRPVLYINPPRSGFETPFAHSFHDLLRSHLIQKGIAVTNSPDAVNAHCTNATFCRPMLLDYRVETLEHKDRWHVYEPRTEVIISTSITDGDLVVFSRSDIYYINPGDQDHYATGTRSLKVVDK